MQRVYDKINKATENDMRNINFWKEIIDICNDVRANSISIKDLSKAEQYFVRASYIIGKLGGEI